MQQERLFVRHALMATAQVNLEDTPIAIAFYSVSGEEVRPTMVVHLAGSGANEAELRALGQAVWAGLR